MFLVNSIRTSRKQKATNRGKRQYETISQAPRRTSFLCLNERERGKVGKRKHDESADVQRQSIKGEERGKGDLKLRQANYMRYI